MVKYIARALLCAGLFAIGLSAPANASVVYSLTLTATSDTDGTPLSTYNGTGTIMLSSTPGATGETDYLNAAVTFLVDGQSFAGTATSVQFLNGNFRNATFSEQIGTSPNRFSLGTSGQYTFFYANEFQDASGTITSALAVSPTPLPGALPLFASGLGVIGFLARRRQRKAAVAA